MGTRGAAPPAVASGAPPSPRIQGKGPGPAPRCRRCRAGGPGARPGGGLRARGPSQRVAVPRRGRGAPGQSTRPLLSPGAAGPRWAELVSLFPPVRVGIGGAARSPVRVPPPSRSTSPREPAGDTRAPPSPPPRSRRSFSQQRRESRRVVRKSIKSEKQGRPGPAGGIADGSPSPGVCGARGVQVPAILNTVQLAEVSWQPALGILSGPDQNTGDETTRLMSLPWESVRR
ncbi:SPRY domain-containing SOCS box protein 1 isoform X2 [Trachypithecus francoisi]|uniref:SPRY domain-containing SOCS box protein 1 isoform X2 n=1 Tax=Trachypithecus francoisi TaxID=54180 RepID=UPI00141A7FDA|nr:SPRY domain-containing SOCS box protein 1 isoform X2 [Trachypithecus francoisi]